MSHPDDWNRLLADRYIRDSARALVAADVEHLRTNLGSRTLASRAVDRLSEGASDLYEEAVELAEDNKGALAALVAAVVVWFTRNPILDLFGFADEDEESRDDTHRGRDEAGERITHRTR